MVTVEYSDVYTMRYQVEGPTCCIRRHITVVWLLGRSGAVLVKALASEVEEDLREFMDAMIPHAPPDNPSCNTPVFVRGRVTRQNGIKTAQVEIWEYRWRSALQATVPQGARPGQQFQVRLPDGRTMTLTVPQGASPGSKIPFGVPPAQPGNRG
jgi:hypothetical protein